MQFSPQQDKALLSVDDWLKQSNNQVFRLFGYAGTGKTTLAKHFAQNVDGMVLFGAYTGKAAHVLRTKGCKEASTIHSMIYSIYEKSKQTLRKYENELLTIRDIKKPTKTELARADELEKLIKNEKRNLSKPAFTRNDASPVRDAELIIIDECSMVDETMGEDLLSFGTKVLVLGDPAQLPPVRGGGFFTEQQPDVMLTEVHRQARDNPIIEMATRVRNGDTLPLGTYGTSCVVNKINKDDVLSADQLLVGKNLTRKNCNRRVREHLGIKNVLPVNGDRLVCLRNNHDLGLLNGGIWNVVEAEGNNADAHMRLSLQSDDSEIALDVEAHTHYFLGKEEDMPWWERKEAEEFDYGYALTVHKSQGSQWNNVCLFDESNVFKKDSKRWLYTGITRAAESVRVFRG
jgi:exodeoxyribonuclease-5